MVKGRPVCMEVMLLACHSLTRCDSGPLLASLCPGPNARSGSSQIGIIGRGSANRDTRAPLRVEVLLIQIHQDGKMGSFCADVLRCGYNPARQSVLDAKVPLINFWLHVVVIHGTEAD